MIQKRILITGGAGFFGHYLANYLTGKVDKIRVLDNIDCNDSDFGSGVEFIKGDIRDYNLLLDVTRDVQLVIHGCGVPSFFKTRDLHSINVTGCANILRASRANGIEKTIYISSVSVYGMPTTVPIYEDFPLLGSIPLAESKIRAERECETYRKDGMVITIFRPQPFMGAGRVGIFGILFDWIKDGRKIPVIGSGDNKIQLLDIEDFSEAVWLAMKSPPEKANDTFNMGTERFGTIKEDLSELIEFAGNRSKIITTPSKLIKAVLRSLEILKVSPLYSGMYVIADKELTVSVEKAKSRLGWHAKRSNAQSLIHAYKWYLDNYRIIDRRKGWTNRMMMEQGILKIIKKLF